MKGFLSEVKIEWSDSFDQDGDGKIQIYEVMESLDKILDKHFNDLRERLAKKATLAKDFYDIHWEVKLLSPHSAHPSSPKSPS